MAMHGEFFLLNLRSLARQQHCQKFYAQQEKLHWLGLMRSVRSGLSLETMIFVTILYVVLHKLMGLYW